MNNPCGLSNIILKFLSFHVGVDNAIKRRDLLEQLHTYPGLSEMQDRQLRMEIGKLRKDGNLICSLASEDGGYYMASSLQEFTEFTYREFGAKIADMAETLKAMERSAQLVFGDAFQPTLLEV